MTDSSLTRAYLRLVGPADETFLYDVFSTTWESEVAALPNPKLAQHVLRIQHIAQERRFAARFPSYQRYVVVEDGTPAGRLYLHQDGPLLHLVDLTLLPEFQSRGIGTRIVRDLLEHAGAHDRSVTLRVPRRNHRATDFYAALGFRLVGMDDLDNHFEWVAAEHRPTVKELVEAVVKEDEAGSRRA